MLTLNGKKTDTLKDFEAGVAQLGDGDRATVRYLTIDDPNSTELRSIRMDRLWFPAHHCDRNDTSGVWDCHDLPAGPAPKPAAVSSTRFPKYPDPRMNALAPSLAMVTFDMPYSVSGITERNYHGTGLVVDAQRGLVVVDRNTVPVAVGDVTVTFAGTVQVPGRVVYVHPLHDFAVVAYDPKLLGSTPVKSARLQPRELAAGERIWVVGLSPRQRAARAQHRDRQPRSARAAAVAHHALPRQQHRDRAAGESAARVRRRARGRRRRRARHLVELCVRERAGDRPGHPRRADRPGRRHARAGAHRARAAFARGGNGRDAAVGGARDRPAGELDAAPDTTQRHAPPGAHRGAHGGRLAGRRAAAVRRPAAGDRRQRGHALSRGGEGRRRQGTGEGHHLARRRRADARGADCGACRARMWTAWCSGRGPRCRRRTAP